MSEFKGTPEPWAVKAFPNSQIEIHDIVAFIGDRDWPSAFATVHTNQAVNQDPAEATHNARLIAAAPALPEAALEIQQGNHYDDCVCKLCRAITAALGEQVQA